MTLAKLALPLAVLALPLHAAPAPAAIEIPLHIEATAAAVPDGMMAVVRIHARGASQEAARAALDSQRKAMEAALTQLGVADSDRRKLPDITSIDMSPGAMAAVDAAMEASCGKKKCKNVKFEPPQDFTADEEWQVTLRQSDAMLYLQAQAGEQFEVIPVDGGGTFYADPAKARDGAVAKAIATARAEADRYAAALGYKVLRIERVSNTKPALNLPDIVSTFAMMDKRATREAFFQQGSMTVGVAIDFVIAPK